MYMYILSLESGESEFTTCFKGGQSLVKKKKKKKRLEILGQNDFSTNFTKLARAKNFQMLNLS
jgi:hypothetical protein